MVTYLILAIVVTAALSYAAFSEGVSSRRQLALTERQSVQAKLISQADFLMNQLSLCTIGESLHGSSIFNAPLNGAASGAASKMPNSNTGDGHVDGFAVSSTEVRELVCPGSVNDAILTFGPSGTPIRSEVRVETPIVGPLYTSEEDHINERLDGFSDWHYLPESTRASIIIETENGSEFSDQEKGQVLDALAEHYQGYSLKSGSPTHRVQIIIIENK